MEDEVIGLSPDGGGYLVRGPDGTVRSVPGATPMRGELPSIGGAASGGQLGQPSTSQLTPDELAVLSDYMGQPAPQQRQPVMLEEQRIAPSPGWAQGLTDAEMQVLAPLAGGNTPLPQQPVSAGEVMAQAEGRPPVLGAMIPEIPVDTGPPPVLPPPPSARFDVAPVAGGVAGPKPGDAPAQPVAATQAANTSTQPTPAAELELPGSARDVRRARLENVVRYGGQDGEVREGIMDAAGNASDYSSGEMAAYGRVADVYRQEADLERQAREAARDQAKRVDEQMETALETQRNARIEMPKRNAGELIRDILSAALGGFAAGILGTENTALEAIRERIQNQIDIQRNNADLAQRNVEARAREALRQAGVAASDAEMRQVGRSLSFEEAAAEVRRYAAGVDNEEVRARMLALAGNVSGEATQIREGIYRNLEEAMRRDERVRAGGRGQSGTLPPLTLVDAASGRTSQVVLSYGPGGNYRTYDAAMRAWQSISQGSSNVIGNMTRAEQAQQAQQAEAPPPRADSWFTPQNLERDPERANNAPPPPQVLRRLMDMDRGLSVWDSGIRRIEAITRNASNWSDPAKRAEVAQVYNEMRVGYGTNLFQSALQEHELEALGRILSDPNEVTPALMGTWMPRLRAARTGMREELDVTGRQLGYRLRRPTNPRRSMGEVLEETGNSGGQRLPPGVRPTGR